MNKKNKACNNVKAIEILKDLGVGFTPNFIVDPAWERDDFTLAEQFNRRGGSLGLLLRGRRGQYISLHSRIKSACHSERDNCARNDT